MTQRTKPPKDTTPKPAKKRYAKKHGVTRRGPRGGGAPIVEMRRPQPSIDDASAEQEATDDEVA
jgi:hypothetical protein